MKEIAKNKYYELKYEAGENCIYWKMNGFWRDMSVVPDFHKDWETARSLCRPGWKIFSDASACKVVPLDVNREKARNQEESIKKGCAKIALIVNSTITKMSIMRGATESGISEKMTIFDQTQIEEAKKWLAQ